MGNLRVFDYAGNQVRTIQQDGEPWFVLADVCAVLNLGSPHKVADRLDEDEWSLIPVIDALGREQQTTVINESGLYNVVLRSDKPEAKPFRKWVTREVLPSIRKTGGYLAGQEQMSDMELVSQALIVVNNLLSEREHRVKELSGRVEELQPKADYYDDLVERNLLTNIRDAGKEFGMSQKDFVQLLLDNKYIYRDARKRLRPYGNWVDKGMFQMKEFRTKSGFVNIHSLLTVKGRDIIRQDIKQSAILNE